MAVVRPLPKIKGKILSVYEDSFPIRTAKLWNIVPKEITSSTTLTVFTNKLDRWLSSIPDNPPVQGYYHVNKNSLLDYRTQSNR